MDSKETTASQNADATSRLLEEGAQSYIEAITALIEYQREVEKRCRKVLARLLSEDPSVFGVDLKLDRFNRWVEPAGKPEEWWDGTWANLGLVVPKLGPDLGIRWASAHCTLSWEFTDSTSRWFGVWVGVGLPTRYASFLHSEMQRIGRKGVENEGDLVFDRKKLAGDEVVAFEEPLSALLRKWSASLKELGGLKGVLSRIAPGSEEQESPPTT